MMNSLASHSPLLTSSSAQVPDESFLRPSSTLPLEVALKQLLRSEACTDEAFFDYELSQALRALTHAVKSAHGVPAPTLAVKATPPPGASDSSKSRAELAESSQRRIKGSELTLWRLSHACLESGARANASIYLSVRLLCDGATAYGEGNERPCCTREWSGAFLALAAHQIWAPAAALTDNAQRGRAPSSAEGGLLVSQAGVDRRLQLGYLVLLSGTMRAVANQHVPGKRLLLDYPFLVTGVVQELIPLVAFLAGSHDRDQDRAAVQISLHSTFVRPPRLCVEANHFVLHCFHDVASDTLGSHEDIGREAARDDNKPAAPRLLDRDIPQGMWPQLTVFRNALVRCLGWVEADAQAATAHSESERPARRAAMASPSAASAATNTTMPQAVMVLVNAVFGSLLKTHERLANARLAAVRQYGDSGKDYHTLSDALWSSTLRLCVVVRDVAAGFLAVHGGLAVASTAGHLICSTDRDVLMHIASCVARVPAPSQGTASDSDGTVLAAGAALLSAAVCLAAAAPLLPLQTAVWASDMAVTRQVHAVLVQRALPYKDENVLKLASLLSSSIIYALAPSASGIASSIAAESSEQLLDMLAESRDAASQCAIDMLIRAVSERPHSLLPSLFRLLHHGSAQARRNTLEVLAGLPPHCDAHMTDPTGAASSVAAKQRETLRLLAENLLLHLQDEELCLRLQSAALFEKVWPEDVLRPLLLLALTRDPTGRKRAAATSALDSVMAAHAADADTVLLLLEEALEVLEGSATSPLSVTASAADATTSDKSTTESPTTQKASIYATPGDILSHTLLYSTEALTSQLKEEEREAEQVQPPACPQDPAKAPPPLCPSDVSASTRSKLRDRLLAVVGHSILVWARHVTAWSAATHLDPLLLLVQAISSETAAQLSSGDRVVDRQGFIWRCITSLYVSLTDPAFGSSTNVLVSVLESICDVLFATGTKTEQLPAVTGGTANVDESVFADWLCTVKAWADLSPSQPGAGDATVDAQRRDATNKVLAPLLFLRACDNAVFRALSAGDLDTNEVTHPSEDAHIRRLASLWQTLWRAVTQAPYRAGFDAVPEAQRVLLEVLTHFPAAVYFATLEQAVDWTKEARYHNIFLARVLTFGLCSYLSHPVEANVAEATARQETLDAVTEGIVVPWMSEATERSSPSRAGMDQQLQRLSLSVIDAYALIESLTLSQGPSCTTAACGLQQVLDTPTQWLMGGVLPILSAAYRTQSAHSDSSGDEKNAVQAATVLPKLQLCLAVQRRVLALFEHQSTAPAVAAAAASGPATISSSTALHALTAEDCYVRWCQQYLPALIELANAAAVAAGPSKTANGATGLAAEAEAVAVQCTELLFFAVMVCRRVSHESTATTSPCPLMKLTLADREALTHFAVGTTRYHKSPVIQQSGVKLLSALLGAAPELFEDVSTSRDSPSNLVLLQESTQALFSVSLMHPDAQTRRTAEQVLQLLNTAQGSAGAP